MIDLGYNFYTKDLDKIKKYKNPSMNIFKDKMKDNSKCKILGLACLSAATSNAINKSINKNEHIICIRYNMKVLNFHIITNANFI